MYNTNKYSNKSSFSQKNISLSKHLFSSENFYSNYLKEKSPINKPKRKFNDFEINKIIERCKKNIKNLQNTYINKNQLYFNKQKNNIILNDYYKNINSNYNNIYNNINQTNKNYSSNNLIKNRKSQSSIISNRINYNNYNSQGINKIINTFSNKNSNNRLKLSRNDNTNITLNNNDELFYSNNNKENNMMINNNQKNFYYYLTQRDFYNNKNINNKIIRNKNDFQVNGNSKFKKNKNKDKIIIIDQNNYNKNYLNLINDLNSLKSTVINYKKTNIELKNQIQQLNSKIEMLTNRNKKDILNKEEKIKEKCYIKKRISSFKGKTSKEKEKEKFFFEKRINNTKINKKESPIKFNSNLDINFKSNLEMNNIINNFNNYKTINNKENIVKNKYQKNIKLKSRNLINNYKISKFNTLNYNDEKNNTSSYLNNYNINTTGLTNNNTGKMINISEIINNNTINSNYINSNYSNNNSKKDDIIEKRIFLRKHRNGQIKNNCRTTNCSSNLDINELYKITKNNFLDISNINQLPKKEIIINFSQISLGKKNANKNVKKYKSSSNLLNNYIYIKKTKEIKQTLSKKDIKNENDNSKSINKIGIIKLPLSGLNITPIKKKDSKLNRICETKKNIDKNNLRLNFKNNKNSLLERLLKNNHKNEKFYEIDNNNLYLFGIDNKNNLIQFDVGMKQYSFWKLYEINDLSNSFHKDYIYNSSIILNDLKGLYILTGIKVNILYYFNASKNMIYKICSFKYSHEKGCLLFDELKKRIYVFSGKNSKKCEYYCFINENIIEMPELNIDRVNSSYTISNNKIICLFGYSYNKNEYLKSIEVIDYEGMDKWETISPSIELDFNIERCTNIIFKVENNKLYLFFEKNNYENTTKIKIYLYDIIKNKIKLINNLIIEKYKEEKCIWKKIKVEKDIKFCFGKNLQFLELPKKMNNNYFDNNNDNIAVILDKKNNAYYFDKNQMKIEIYINSLLL